MEKLESIAEAIEMLQQGLVVCARADGVLTLFMRNKGKVRVKTENSAYIISGKEFEELFLDETFFIYDDPETDVEISDDKDKEYYSWRHK